MTWLKGSIAILMIGLVWGTPRVTQAQEQEVAAAGKPVYDHHCASVTGAKRRGAAQR